ncbi:MAG: hypothetical protein KIT70_10305 [Anaerolineales bacterium]|nr:MAG: hypothetical protein KIT70_10305 [Anaerolineales bacterium]
MARLGLFAAEDHLDNNVMLSRRVAASEASTQPFLSSKPIFANILKSWIYRSYQLKLLLPRPSLDALFRGNRIVYAGKLFGEQSWLTLYLLVNLEALPALFN